MWVRMIHFAKRSKSKMPLFELHTFKSDAESNLKECFIIANEAHKFRFVFLKVHDRKVTATSAYLLVVFQYPAFHPSAVCKRQRPEAQLMTQFVQKDHPIHAMPDQKSHYV